MQLIDHAKAVLDSLAARRDDHGRISPITSTELLAEHGRNPSHYAKAYAQANSLLDIAAMEADLPLIGRLVLFDHKDDIAGPWAIWQPYAQLLYEDAPRLKAWSDPDLAAIRNMLRSGAPHIAWKELGNQSEVWLQRAIKAAHEATS